MALQEAKAGANEGKPSEFWDKWKPYVERKRVQATKKNTHTHKGLLWHRQAFSRIKRLRGKDSKTRDAWEETEAFAEKYEAKEKLRQVSWGKIIFFCRKILGKWKAKK
jgi:hypothetical protein